MIKCGKCGTLNSDNSKFCISCHSPLVGTPQVGNNKDSVATGTIQCKKCGAINSNNSKFCISCHESLIEAPVYENNGANMNVKTTGLSIVALVCSLTVPLIGLLLSMLDLSKKDGRKTLVSKIAFVISAIGVIAGVIGFIKSGSFFFWPRIL